MTVESRRKGTLSKRPVCVLIAEGDKEMRSFLTSSLRRDGYDVVEIADNSELHAFLLNISSTMEHNSEDPGIDVIVSEMRMPGKTALDVIGDFRRFMRKVPIILITAFCDQQTIEEAKALGAAAVFDKPFDIHDFKIFLKGLVSPESF
ncbi:MAG: response regulator [Myxococcota bacterium]|nr:response regulator [Myxococcota bacterium]